MITDGPETVITITERPFCNLRVFDFSSFLFVPLLLRNHRDLREITLYLCSTFVFEIIYSECVAKASGRRGPTFLQSVATCRATKFNVRPPCQLLIDCLNDAPSHAPINCLNNAPSHAQLMLAIH